MGVGSAVFSSAGQTTRHYVPGVYSRRNTIGVGGGVSSGNLCILGSSTGGEPNKLLCFADKSEANETLVGGPLLDAVCNALSGSKTYVPQQVYAVKVSGGTKSSLTLSNNSGAIITLTSRDYGVHANQIKLSIVSTAGGKSIEASYRGSDEKAEGVKRASFSIACVDPNAISASCTIDKNGVHLSAKDANGDIADDALDAGFDECEKLSELKAKVEDKLNAGSNVYSMTLLDARDEAKTCELDYTTATVHLKADNNNNEGTTFFSNLAAIVEVLKSFSCIGSVEVADAARVAPNDVTQYFSGAVSGGEPTALQWAEALEMLEKEDIQIIATSSTDPVARNLICDHCVTMSTVEKRGERTFIVGMEDGTSIEEAAAVAKELNTELGSLVITGATSINCITGEREKISPAMLACKVAGVEAAMSVSLPVTNKVLNVVEFSHKYKRSELEAMIKAGVMPFGENESGELVCIRGVTTYQGDSLILNERSMIRSVLYMDRDLRKAFSSRIGTNSSPSESEILQVLDSKAKSWLTQDLITQGEEGLVFNTKVSFDGDKCYIKFDRYIRAPNNFVFITGTNRVYSSTVEI